MASHNMIEVERMCERVIMMKKGVIVDDDTPAQLLARYGRNNLEEVFLDVARGTRRGGAGGGAVTTARIPAARDRSANILHDPGVLVVARVGAMVRRYWYLLRSSWPRVLDLIYWPTVQMFMWGLLQTYIGQQSGCRRAPDRHSSAP